MLTIAKLQSYQKWLSMSMICQKTITSSIQIIQILTKRNGKRTQNFIVKVHLSNMNLLLHISSLRTLWVLHNTQTKTKKEPLCTLNIISCRIPLTIKSNRDLQNLIQRKFYSRGNMYNNKWKKHLKNNFRSDLLFIIIFY